MKLLLSFGVIELTTIGEKFKNLISRDATTSLLNKLSIIGYSHRSFLSVHSKLSHQRVNKLYPIVFLQG